MTCERCGRASRNGRYCAQCWRGAHAWEGGAGLYRCRVCGLRMVVRRAYSRKAGGSVFTRQYGEGAAMTTAIPGCILAPSRPRHDAHHATDPDPDADPWGGGPVY